MYVQVICVYVCVFFFNNNETVISDFQYIVLLKNPQCETVLTEMKNILQIPPKNLAV